MVKVFIYVNVTVGFSEGYKRGQNPRDTAPSTTLHKMFVFKSVRYTVLWPKCEHSNKI